MIDGLPPLQSDVDLCARTAVGEIRGGTQGQMENVIWALFHRWQSSTGQWAKDDTLATTCQRPEQFSGWTQGDPNFLVMHKTGWHDEPYRRAVGFIASLIDRYPMGDPIHGARHYHSRAMTTFPMWAFSGVGGKDEGRSKPITPVVDDGAHLFYEGIF